MAYTPAKPKLSILSLQDIPLRSKLSHQAELELASAFQAAMFFHAAEKPLMQGFSDLLLAFKIAKGEYWYFKPIHPRRPSLHIFLPVMKAHNQLWHLIPSSLREPAG